MMKLGYSASTASGRLADGSKRAVECGASGVSGGGNPNVHLASHQRGRPQWQADIAAFVPGKTLPQGMIAAGAASGIFSTHGALQSGVDVANAALCNIGMEATSPAIPKTEDAPLNITPFWHVADAKRAWLDQQNDVTVKDVKLAHQENFKSVENLERSTT